MQVREWHESLNTLIFIVYFPLFFLFCCISFKPQEWLCP